MDFHAIESQVFLILVSFSQMILKLNFNGQVRSLHLLSPISVSVPLGVPFMINSVFSHTLPPKVFFHRAFLNCVVL